MRTFVMAVLAMVVMAGGVAADDYADAVNNWGLAGMAKADVESAKAGYESYRDELNGRRRSKTMDLTHSICPTCRKWNSNDYYTPYCDCDCWVAAGRPSVEACVISHSEVMEMAMAVATNVVTAYEVYAPDFGERLETAVLVKAYSPGEAAEKHVLASDRLHNIPPKDAETVDVKVRDVLGDRKWRTFRVEPKLHLSYAAKEKT